MSFDSAQSQSRNPTPARAFATVFLGVFLVVFVGSGLITFLLPERFVGVARVRVRTDKQLEIFQSAQTLARVAEQLDLNRSFAQRYGEKEPLSADRTMDMLRRGVQLRRIRGTELAEVRVYSHSPDEAAQLANAVARVGVSGGAKMNGLGSGTPELVELAIPASKPARPNKALNLYLGAIVGAFLGIMAGGLGARMAIAPHPGSAESQVPTT